MKRWVIFDADNTLWNVEVLYDRARQLFLNHLAAEVARIDPKSWVDAAAIEAMQRHRDVQLQASHGYSASRFARSFEDTAAFLVPFAPPEWLRAVRDFAAAVFENEAELAPGLEEALQQLRQEFSLAIITAGEQWVQERRLNSFRFREFFDQTVIVPMKIAGVFEEFCHAHSVDRDHSWVVGDSIRSDICPALEARLRAIHFEAPNWSYEHAPLPEGVPVARTMQEVVSLVSGGGICPSGRHQVPVPR